jgi:hypothetical protein
VPINNFKSHEIRFSDQIRNCEDVILEETLGIAFLGCDPGRDRWNTVMVNFISYHQTSSMKLPLMVMIGNVRAFPSRSQPKHRHDLHLRLRHHSIYPHPIKIPRMVQIHRLPPPRPRLRPPIFKTLCHKPLPPVRQHH